MSNPSRFATRKEGPRPLRPDEIGKPGQRRDGTFKPWGIFVDGRIIAGYETRKAAENDLPLYVRSAGESVKKKIDVQAVPGGTLMREDNAAERGSATPEKEGTGT